jgi:hypothetical protein
MSLLPFYKIGEHESKNRYCPVGLVPVGEEQLVRKGCGRVNIVQRLCVYLCNWKNDTC